MGTETENEHTLNSVATQIQPMVSRFFGCCCWCITAHASEHRM